MIVFEDGYYPNIITKITTLTIDIPEGTGAK